MVRHRPPPRFQRPNTDLAYQPMVELLVYLRANDFKTSIVSGGCNEFMRAVAEKIYGIPPEQVIGSSGRDYTLHFAEVGFRQSTPSGR